MSFFPQVKKVFLISITALLLVGFSSASLADQHEKPAVTTESQQCKDIGTPLVQKIANEVIIKPACSKAGSECAIFSLVETLASELDDIQKSVVDATKDNTNNESLINYINADCFKAEITENKSSNPFVSQISQGLINALKVFNNFLLLLALILVAIVTGNFIMTGASAGTMFSGGASILKRPAKYTVSFAVLVPLSSFGGLSILQLILSAFLVIGSSFANYTMGMMESSGGQNVQATSVEDYAKTTFNQVLNKNILRERAIGHLVVDAKNEIRESLKILNPDFSTNGNGDDFTNKTVVSSYTETSPSKPHFTPHEIFKTSAIYNCLSYGRPHKSYNPTNPDNTDIINNLLLDTHNTDRTECNPKQERHEWIDPTNLPASIYNKDAVYKKLLNKARTNPAGLSGLYQNLLGDSGDDESVQNPKNYAIRDEVKTRWQGKGRKNVVSTNHNLLNNLFLSTQSCINFTNKSKKKADTNDLKKEAFNCVSEMSKDINKFLNEVYVSNFKQVLINSNPTSALYDIARWENAEDCKAKLGAGVDEASFKRDITSKIENHKKDKTPFKTFELKSGNAKDPKSEPITHCLTSIFVPNSQNKFASYVTFTSAKNTVVNSQSFLQSTESIIEKYKAVHKSSTLAFKESFIKFLSEKQLFKINNDSGSSSALSHKYGWAGSGVMLLKYLSSPQLPKTHFESPTMPATTVPNSKTDKNNKDKSDEIVNSTTNHSAKPGMFNWGIGEFIAEAMFDNLIQHIVNRMILTDKDGSKEGHESSYWKGEDHKISGTHEKDDEWDEPIVVMKYKLNYCYDSPSSCMILPEEPIADLVELGKLAISTAIYMDIFEGIWQLIETQILPSIAVGWGILIIFLVEIIAQYVLFIIVIAKPLLYLAGASLIFVIPLIPLYFIAQASLQYIILFVESIITLPVWALLMLREDRTQQDTQIGFSMFGQVLLYPVLIVMSVFIGVIITKYGLALLNLTAYPMFEVINLSGGTLIASALSVLIFISIYTVLAFFIVKFAFGFVNKFPNEVFTWLGISSVEEVDESGLGQAGVAVATKGVMEKLGGQVGGAAKQASQMLAESKHKFGEKDGKGETKDPKAEDGPK